MCRMMVGSLDLVESMVTWQSVGALVTLGIIIAARGQHNSLEVVYHPCLAR